MNKARTGTRARHLVPKYPILWAQGVVEEFQKHSPRASDFLTKYCRIPTKTLVTILRCNDPSWQKVKDWSRKAEHLTDVKELARIKDQILAEIPVEAIDEGLQCDLRFEGGS